MNLCWSLPHGDSHCRSRSCSLSVTRSRLIAIGELVVSRRGVQRIDGQREMQLSV